MNNAAYYFDVLYPLQDRALKTFREAETGLYLTGGTAASRGYLQHRFSDDLDFFVNDDPNFSLWAERLIQAAQKHNWECQILLKEERFVRFNIFEGKQALKIECVNDVPARVGDVQIHPVLGRLDTAENILANKVTAAIDREAPKDLADIWGFCTRMHLSLKDALINADSKAAGIFPADLGRVLCSATEADWQAVNWIKAPPINLFLAELNALGEELLLP